MMTSQIIERLAQGPDGVLLANSLAFLLEDNRDGSLAPIPDTPERVVLVLTPYASGGAPVVVDSQGTEYALGRPGSGNETFVWTAESSKLAVNLGGKPNANFPKGVYDAHLRWYDLTHPAGIRMPFGSQVQRLTIVIE